MLLAFAGRRTGKRYEAVVGRHESTDGELVVVTGSRWRLNLRGGAPVEVVLRARRGRAARSWWRTPGRSCAPTERSSTGWA